MVHIHSLSYKALYQLHPQYRFFPKNKVICKVDGGLVEGALRLMAVNYVFMFNYPPGLNLFCLYLQKCVMQIKDGKKLPSTVISFLNKLGTT